VNNKQVNHPITVGFKRSRRDVLTALTGLAGASLIASTWSSKELFIEAAHAYESTDNKQAAGRVLNSDQMATLRMVCDLVIPRTDTASAADVDTHGFIDNQLKHCYGEQEQTAIATLLTTIDKLALKHHGTTLAALTFEQAIEVVAKFDTPSKDSPINTALTDSFKFLKWLVVLGYVTSEEGATKHLQYIFLPPNGFEADLSLSQTGRAPSAVYFY